MNKILKLIALNFFIFFSCLFIADILVAKFFFPKEIKQTYKISDRYINLREWMPELNSDIFSPQIHETIENMNSIITDKNGFIMGPNSEFDYKDVDIVFLGGSTTECFYVKDSLRFPYLVGEILKSKLNKKILTLNSGISGNGTIHSNLILLSKILSFKPKYVFIMHNINDLAVLSKTGSYWDAPSSRSVIVDPSEKVYEDKNLVYNFLRETKNIFFRNIFMLFKMNFEISDTYFKNKLVDSKDEFHSYRENFFLSNKTDIERVKKNYLNGINTFIEICRSNNLEPILMTQFNRIENNSEDFSNDFLNKGNSKEQLDSFIETYKDFNKIIEEISIEKNVLFLDLNNLIPKQKKYIYDSVHLTNEGSKLASDMIVEFSLKNLEFSSH